MLIQTKIFCSYDNDVSGDVESWWDDFCFDINRYICHSEHENGSVLNLDGLKYPITVQLTFDELTFMYEQKSSFQTITLN